MHNGHHDGPAAWVDCWHFKLWSAMKYLKGDLDKATGSFVGFNKPGAVCISMHISPPGATQVKDKLHNIPRTSRGEFPATRRGWFLSDKFPPTISTRSRLKFPAQNDHHQATAATPYKFPTGWNISMHKFPAHSWRVPRYCPGARGPGIHMIGAL